MKNALIECSRLSKSYADTAGRKTQAVKEVSLAIREGETFGLVGESGCGKTTLGYMLLDLVKPSSGTIRFDGKDISSLSGQNKKDFRKNCQIIFQDPYSSINARKSIAFLIREGLDIHRIGKNRKERDEIVKNIMQSVGLDAAMADTLPTKLSGGQRQRIAIAQSLVLRPRFVVCDEIVSALDVIIQSQVLNLLKKLQKEFSLTFLFISHDLNVVSYMADTIAVMYQGEIVESGAAETLIRNPQHPYTRQLFECAAVGCGRQRN